MNSDLGSQIVYAAATGHYVDNHPGRAQDTYFEKNQKIPDYLGSIAKLLDYSSGRLSVNSPEANPSGFKKILKEDPLFRGYDKGTQETLRFSHQSIRDSVYSGRN